MTFVVNSADDVADEGVLSEAGPDGVCDTGNTLPPPANPGTPECTLRAALFELENDPAGGVVTFSTDGPLFLNSPLGPYSRSITIDGATAPAGRFRITPGDMSPAPLLEFGSASTVVLRYLDLDGSFSHGLRVTATSGFQATSIRATGASAAGMSIETSQNVAVTGGEFSGSGGPGLYFFETQGVTVTGNDVFGNSGPGIDLYHVRDVTVQGNRIGIDPADAPAGNVGAGVYVTTDTFSGSPGPRARNIQIGGVGAGQGNIIAHNSLPLAQTGVHLESFGPEAGTDIRVRGNSMFANEGEGIQLDSPADTDSNGIYDDDEDTLDSDDGTNGLLNSPRITNAFANPGVVEGTLQTKPFTSVTVDVYVDSTAPVAPTPPPTLVARGQGEIYVGSTTVTTDTNGLATWIVTGGPWDLTHHATATANTVEGTSRFSPAPQFAPYPAPTANPGGPYNARSPSGTGSVAVSLDGTATTPGHRPIATYEWRQGQTMLGTGAQLQRNFAIGSHSITLTAIDSLGGTHSASTNVNIIANPPPTASFFFSPTSPLSQNQVQFTDTSTDDRSVVGWTWSFGDGGSSSAQHPTHTYARPGTYTVQLTARDDEGRTASTSQTITVQNRAPTVQITNAPGGLVNARLTFTAQATDPDGSASISWAFGDGATGTGPSAEHRFTAPGTYTVTATATDDKGATATAQSTVQITSAPLVADFTATPAAATTGQTISFRDTSSGGQGPLTFSWTFGDGGTATGPTATRTYAQDGTYTVTLRATDGTTTQEQGRTVTITNRPPTVAASTSLGPFRVGTPITFAGTATDADGSITSTTWDFGDGTTGTGSPTTRTYHQPGTYTVTWRAVDDDGASASATLEVVVETTPLEVALEGPIAVAIGSPATFKDTSTGGQGPYTRTWTTGDGGTSAEPEPALTWNSLGVFQLQLTVRDAAGNFGTATQDVYTYYGGSIDKVTTAGEVVTVTLADGSELRVQSGSSRALLAALRLAADPGAFQATVPRLGPEDATSLDFQPLKFLEVDEIPADGGRIRLSFRYDEAALTKAGVEEKDLTIFYWNGGSWIDVRAHKGGEVPAGPGGSPLRVFDFGIDRAARMVWVEVDHTSQYALAGNSAPATVPAEQQTQNARPGPQALFGGLASNPLLQLTDGPNGTTDTSEPSGTVWVRYLGDHRPVRIVLIDAQGQRTALGDGETARWDTTQHDNGFYIVQVERLRADGAYYATESRNVLVQNDRSTPIQTVVAVASGAAIALSFAAVLSEAGKELAFAMGEDRMRDTIADKRRARQSAEQRRNRALVAGLVAVLLLAFFFSMEAIDSITWREFLAALPFVGPAAMGFFGSVYLVEFSMARASGSYARFRLLWQGVLTLTATTFGVRTALGHPGYINEETKTGEDDEVPAHIDGLRGLASLTAVPAIMLLFLAVGALWRFEVTEHGLGMAAATIAGASMPFDPMPGNAVYRWNKFYGLLVTLGGFALFASYYLALLDLAVLAVVGAVGAAVTFTVLLGLWQARQRRPAWWFRAVRWTVMTTGAGLALLVPPPIRRTWRALLSGAGRFGDRIDAWTSAVQRAIAWPAVKVRQGLRRVFRKSTRPSITAPDEPMATIIDRKTGQARVVPLRDIGQDG